MLTDRQRDIIDAGRKWGWIMEPEAKEVFRLSGIDVPRFCWARTPEEAASFARSIGYPVVAKIVSPEVIHKSDVSGVVVGIADEAGLLRAFDGLKTIRGFEGVIVEEMVGGAELIVGMKRDDQFGPIVLLGMGGTMAEIYGDVALRMAPVAEAEVEGMLKSLKAGVLLEGYRGRPVPSRATLIGLVKRFSDLVMEFGEEVASIDLNPVICSETRTVVADARIMLTF
jgi:acetate---CoA ligase (ADP-forming) subunit beta